MSEVEKLKIEDALLEKGVYIGPTVGVSMLPMLKNRRDTIVVRPKTEKLKSLILFCDFCLILLILKRRLSLQNF